MGAMTGMMMGMMTGTMTGTMTDRPAVGTSLAVGTTTITIRTKAPELRVGDLIYERRHSFVV